MIRWFLQRQIAAFERTWNYDAAYLHALIDIDPRALGTFGRPGTAKASRRPLTAPPALSR